MKTGIKSQLAEVKDKLKGKVRPPHLRFKVNKFLFLSRSNVGESKGNSYRRNYMVVIR